MGKTPRILIVDDEEDYRSYLVDVVNSMGLEVDTAADGFEALAKSRVGFDAVVLDARMPGVDGYEVARRLRKDEEETATPIIMVTGLQDEEDRQRAQNAGIDAYLEKPVMPDELEESIHSVLNENGASRDRETRAKTEQAETGPEVKESVEVLTQCRRRAYQAQIETIERLALAAEYRDKGTGAHVRRIGQYSALLGRCLHLAPGEVEVLQYASQLHDVGKIGIPDSILLKPGQLHEEEWAIMRQHTRIGARILSGSSSRFLQVGEEIALTHHERWDGDGYPRGLSSDDIPLYGRICAVADVFDALTTHRPYRDAVPVPEALDKMKEERGKHFDPELLDLFLENLDRVKQVYEECVEQGELGAGEQPHPGTLRSGRPGSAREPEPSSWR